VQQRCGATQNRADDQEQVGCSSHRSVRPNVRVERTARGTAGAPRAQNISARLRRARSNLSRAAPTHS
jgi:hypothetical protein